MVDPYILQHVLKEASIGDGYIEQFRIIQKALDNILVKLVTNAEIRSDDLESIRRKFSARLRNQIQISIQCVDHLERDKSGKLRFFVSELDLDQYLLNADSQS
jgi:phenylacetate-CoA ligase